jgi:hypothetical protein
MSAGVVQFPDGGKYPAARLTKLDQRVLALIARHLAAYRALQCAFDEAPDSDSDKSKARAGGDRLGGFRTPAASGCCTAVDGRHPKPCA